MALQQMITKRLADGPVTQPKAKIRHGEVRIRYPSQKLIIKPQLRSLAGQVSQAVAIAWLYVTKQTIK